MHTKAWAFPTFNIARRWTAYTALTLFLTFPASAEPDKKEYAPQFGQPGKDVVWEPTPPSLALGMLQMAGTGPRDYVIDLGSGDGRIAILAATRFGARALGIEFNPELVGLSQQAARREGVADKVKFVQGDLFETEFSAATVLVTYLTPEINSRLKPRILALKPGTRVVSHLFRIDDWPPDNVFTLDQQHWAYLWIVPTKVSGEWRVRFPGVSNATLSLEQKYQVIKGALTLDGRRLALHDAKLRGETILFAVMDGGATLVFSGKVSAERIVSSPVK